MKSTFKLRKFSAYISLCGLMMVCLASPTSHAALPDEQWTITAPPTSDPSVGIVIQDSDFLKGSLSNFQAFTSQGLGRGSKVTGVFQCHSTSDLNCDGSQYSQYSATLPRCISASQVDCVSGVGAFKSDGSALSVNYGVDFPGVRPADFKGDASIGLPTGGSSFLVDIPSAPHPGGTKYLVIAQMTGSRERGNASFTPPQFQAGIFAVSIINGRYWPSRPTTDISAFASLGVYAYQRLVMEEGGKFSACAQATDTTCAMPWALPLDIKFSLTFRFSSKISGWLHGRVSNPEADITTDSQNNEIVTVSGNPSIVPIITGWKKKAELPPTLASFYGAHSDLYQNGTGFGCNNFCSPSQWISVLRDSVFYDQLSMDESVAWLAAINDTAPVAPTEWSIRSMENGSDSSCYRDTTTLSGILTTNATNFLSGPPTFDATSGTLDYKVVAPHFLPSGEVFKGDYNLVIRSSVARCIYHFTSAPIKATVSIVDSSGISQVATTVISESDGWLKMRATGFTFSNPTIKVKLSQDAPAPAVTPAPSTSSTPVTTPEPAPSQSKSTVLVTPSPKPTQLVKPKTIACINVQTHLIKNFPSTPAGCPNHFKPVPTKKK